MQNQHIYRALLSLMIAIITIQLTTSSTRAQLFIASATGAQPSPAACLIYAVDQKGDSSAQLFTIDLRNKTVNSLGSLTGFDLEGIAVHPLSHLLYATASEHSKPPSQLFLVDPQNGALTLLGNTGFSDVADLAFRSTDATLWGWVEDQGLIQIDVTSGVSKLVLANPKKIKGIVWNNDGTLLYGAVGSNLWAYNPTDNTFNQIADNLPDDTTSLEIRPDGLLLVGVNKENSVDILAYDTANKHITMQTSIADSRYDPDDIAWLGACGNASPGGQANLLKEIVVDKQSVCPNEDILINVRAEHPENVSNPVDVVINGQWGASQYLHFAGDPGPRLIQVAALTPEKYSDSREITVTVVTCGSTAPIVYTQPNPYHDLTVDFQIDNADALQLQNPSYRWDFGDGQITATTVPFVSHFYGDSLSREQLYTGFQSSLIIQQNGQPDLSTHKTVSVWNIYAFTKKLGFIQPRVTSTGKTTIIGSSLFADYTIKNLESQPVQFTSRSIEYQFCDTEQHPIFSLAENMLLQIEGQQEITQSFELPLEDLSNGVCSLAIHLSGQMTGGMKAYASAYFEVKSNPFATLSINDSASAETLNQIIQQGWLGDINSITDEDLYRLRQEGKITQRPADLVAASAISTQKIEATDQADPIGQPCKDSDTPPRLGISCQVTKEWTYTPAYIVNAQKGDTILDPGCDGTIGELLRNVSPPQKFSHSGIVTKDHYEIRHATAVEGRYSAYGSTDGIRPDVLQYGWPGTITQQVYQAFEGQYFTDPENKQLYLVTGFSKETKKCGDIGSVAPLVVKPPLEFEATARPKLHEVADIALQINGHYRFFGYTNSAIALDPNKVAPEGTGWAVGTVPIVCSDFIWYAMKLAGLTLEGDYLEPNNVAVGAERDASTLDGLYLYRADERQKAGDVLHSKIYDQAYQGIQDKLGGFGWLAPLINLFTDAPAKTANQVVNCFASDQCNHASKDSNQWQQTDVGRSVSPDNILFWDASPTGGYGFWEPLVYQPGRYERVYRWLPSQESGTITAHVHYEGNLVQDALVMLAGFTRLTDSNGEVTFDAIPAGVYQIRAVKEVAPGQMATVIQDVTVTMGTTNQVDLFLSFNSPPQPTATVVVTIEHLHAYGCLGEWFLSHCWNPESGLDYYTITHIDGNVLNTIDQTVEGDPTGHDFFPQWDLHNQVDPSRASIPIEIDIWDKDSGLRGGDDHVDIYPQGGRTLKMILDLNTCQISGGVAGACGQQLYSKGGDDGHEDLSEIWLRVEVVRSQNDQAMTTMTAVTPSSGGKLTTFNHNLSAQFPANAVVNPITAIYKRLSSPSQELNQRRNALHSFTLEAKASDGSIETQFSQPYTLTLSYTDEQLSVMGVAESSLNVVFWNGNSWIDTLPCTGCSVDMVNNRATVVMNRFTEFALVGDMVGDRKQNIYMPLIFR